jgi:hypothetical protein
MVVATGVDRLFSCCATAKPVKAARTMRAKARVRDFLMWFSVSE